MSERLAPGSVRDAILETLRNARGPMAVRDIRDGVAARVGRDVPASSVRSYLRLSEGSSVYKLGRGQYTLPDTTLSGEPSAPLGPAVVYGNTKLFQAECVSWLRGQPLHSFHAVVTDPPYGLVEYSKEEQAKLRNGHGGVWRIPPSFDGHQRSPVPRFTTLRESDTRALGVFFEQWAHALYPVLVPGAHIFIATNPLLSYLVSTAVARTGFERRGEIVRLVMTMRGGDRPKNAHTEFAGVTVMPRSMWEPWLVFRKPLEGRVQDNLKLWATGGLQRPSAERPFGDVIQSAPTRPKERMLAPHPTLKPQAFLRQIVRASLPLGKGIVLDPFAGSGSTLAAAEALGYQSVGVELDSQYVEMARSAIPALAGFKA